MIKDSGERRTFGTGAVRDCASGKGRFDLMPLDVIHARVDSTFLWFISRYMETGDDANLVHATEFIMDEFFANRWTALLALAKHFENGAIKYTPDNWKKGIDTRSYVDSMVRHYCKHMAGYDDEPHHVACLWNLICCIWTLEHKPELNSFPTKVRCVETDCYYNDDAVCTAGDGGEPAKGKECHIYSED